MKHRPQKRTRLPERREHKSGHQTTQGRVYVPLDSLAEAKTYSDGMVLLDGDGVDLVSCPARFVHCTPETLQTLLTDLVRLMFRCPPWVRVHYARWVMVGADAEELVTGELTVNPFLQSFRLEGEIVSVLSGDIQSLTRSVADLLEEAREREPNVVKWPVRLAWLYKAQALQAKGKMHQELAVKALRAFEATIPMFAGWDSMLHEAADMAVEAGELDKAKGYADWMLETAWRNLASGRVNPPNGEHIHRGNVILGKLALISDDVDQAAFYLEEAGKAPWKMRWDSVPPDMSLAQALLGRDRREAVIQYLELCRTIWTDGRDKLDSLVGALEQGQTVGEDAWEKLERPIVNEAVMALWC